MLAGVIFVLRRSWLLVQNPLLAPRSDWPPDALGYAAAASTMAAALHNSGALYAASPLSILTFALAAPTRQPHCRLPTSAMPPKTVEEQLAELEMEAEAPAAPPPKSSKPAKAPRKTAQQDIDALKELEELEALEKFQAPEAPRPSSRSNTPKLSSSSTASSKKAGVATPPSSGSGRTSEEKAQPPRKSGESARSFHQGFAPTDEEEPAIPAPAPAPAPQQQSGGWGWGGFSVGGLLSTASATADAARKRAEAAYQDLQKNEEAQRWAEQVRGVRGNVNLDALRGLGMLLVTASSNLHASDGL
jgi:hypothetical protein